MDENENNVPEPRTPQFLSLLDTLACPVCYEPTPPPIMQCINGHNICLSCQERVNACPVCRGAHSPIRNRFAESAFVLLVDKLPCKYAAEGCKEIFQGNQILQKHEAACQFRDIICRLRCTGHWCHDTIVPLSKYLDHLQLLHRLKEVNNDFGAVTAQFQRASLNGYYYQLFEVKNLDPWVLRCFGKQFVAMRIFTASFVFFWVVGNLTEDEAKNYSVTIKIKNYLRTDGCKKEITWQGPVQDVHKFHLEAEKEFQDHPERYLKIPVQFYSYFSDSVAGILDDITLKHFFKITSK